VDFAAPHLLWLTLAAPLVAALAALLWRRRLRATAAWAARGLWDRLLTGFSPRRTRLAVVCLALTALGAALALARPRWGESEQEIERRGVDVVVVLDTSLSMATRDLEPNRFWVAQTLVRRLVGALPGHRLALIQAEGGGDVVVPLTLDDAAVDIALDSVLPNSLPTPGTELAPALERALEVFPEGGAKHRVMVLLSDGEDHGSALGEAIDKLRDGGVRVHAIGVGTLEGQPLELPSSVGTGRVQYKTDEKGQVVVSRLVEETLEKLARETGGSYLRATGVGVDLAPIAESIERMDRNTYGSEVVSQLEERFQWPLMLAVTALGLHLLVPVWREGGR